MVDIHCHILPEMDDGARSRKMSLQMCQMAAKSGVTDIIATPHMHDLFAGDDFKEKVDVRINYMNQVLKDYNVGLTLHKGAEVYASNDFIYAPDLHDYALAGSRYILFELDLVTGTFNLAKEAISVILSQDMIPVMAHPERYAFTHADYTNVNRLADCGALFQCNIGSLTGEMGKRSYKLGLAMLNAGAISFLASDAHRFEYRNTDFNAMTQSIKENKKADSSNLDLYLHENPAKILTGGRVENPSFETLKKKLF